jgi:hypothetical protein
LAGSDQECYGWLRQEPVNKYNLGQNSYPETLTAAYELMLHDVRDQDWRHQPDGDSGMAFNTVGGGTPATNTQPNPRPDVTSHSCGKTGHFSDNCAEVNHANGTVLSTSTHVQRPPNANATSEGVAMTNFGSIDDDDGDGDGGDIIGEFNFLNDGTVAKCFDEELHGQHKAATGEALPTYWILLDNQSTVNVFCSRHLLGNIREAPSTCRITCNAGVVEVETIGDFPGYPAPVWYHPGGSANIHCIA